ncbi:MAG: DNA internalization-related competence protein ComEC/Rec2 [Deltaproteobacteria bacterium]|nr:DNA internalization-related competence protein ComEC/Rec2 [Deltaproteobacteria bacterium]
MFQIDTVFKYKALVKVLKGRGGLGRKFIYAFWYFKNLKNDFHPGDIVEGRFKIERLNLLSNFGDYFDESYYFRKNIFWQLKDLSIKKIEHHHDFFQSLRIKIKKIFKKFKSEQYFKILLLGEPQKEEEFQKIRNLGISHLFVISGLHLGVIFFFFYSFLLGLFSYHHQKGCLLVSFLICLFYTNLCYPHVCLDRAYLMISCFCVNEFLERKSSYFSILIFVSSLLILKVPSVLWDLSFQLSFVALLFLGLGLRFVCHSSHEPQAQAGIQKAQPLLIKNKTWKLVLTCFFIYVGTAPLILFYFHQISLTGFFLNILLIPFFSVFLIPTLFVTLIFILLNLSFFYFWVLNLLDFVFQKMILIFKTIPSFPLSFSIEDWLSLFCIYLFLFIFMFNHTSLKKIKPLFILVLFLIFLSKNILSYNQNELQVTFLDVGHGDAIFVRFPQGKTMLIDAGNRFKEVDMGKRVVVPFLQWKGVRKLDYLVMTHADMDHIGGARAVLERIKVQEVWLNSVDSQDENVADLTKTLTEKNIFYKTQAQNEEVLKIDGVDLQFLWPYQNCNGFNRNFCSLVFMLQFGKTQFLFTGDIEHYSERFLNFSHFKNLKYRILKVAHHGSYTSTSQNFLGNFKTNVSVISCGFRKPHRGVLKRLQKIKSQILRTDDDGAVQIRTDGKKIKIDKKS